MNTVFPHPTVSEAMYEAVLDASLGYRSLNRQEFSWFSK
jgi:hypothetical protein